MERCDWCKSDELYIKYHDEEWGVPNHDDKIHFEFIILEAFQAGLNWLTILKKRENFRMAFDQFDAYKIEQYDESKINELMNNSGIIRNKSKILASINNAKRFIEIQKEFGSFDHYIWSFVNHEPVINHYESTSEVPATTHLSDEVSKDLKKRGFKYMGSTVVYAHLQAVGVIDDHLEKCFRKRQL